MTFMNRDQRNHQVALSHLSVDYPRQDEKITGSSYAFRISAPAGVQKVDITVDQTNWRPCRLSEGYWWYDWSGYQNGEHEISARIVTADGKMINSKPHEFTVALELQHA